MSSRVAIVLGLALGLTLTASCAKKKQVASGPPGVPVVVAAAERRTVPYEVTSFGHVEPYRSVSITSQVGGVLSRVDFQEGQLVRRGDPLFLIEPSPYRAALQAAQAQLERDRVVAANLKETVDRYTLLAQKNYITAQQNSDLLAQLAEARAAAQVDQARADQARLDLENCTIKAPIEGKIGARLVDAGSVVRANGDSPLAVINQIQPIYVRFTIPEQHLPDVLKGQAAQPLEVAAVAAGEESDPHQGRLVFIDNTVDVATGTVQLKGEFPNQDATLWPGEFVNVTLVTKQLADAIVVPSRAVSTGQQGDFVFIVKPDATAELRPVKVSYRLGEDAVVQGLQEGEKVVVDGQLRLRPGGRVMEKPAVVAGGAGGAS